MSDDRVAELEWRQESDGRWFALDGEGHSAVEIYEAELNDWPPIVELRATIAALVKAGDDLADAFTYSQNVQGTLTADLFTVRQWHAAKGKR